MTGAFERPLILKPFAEGPVGALSGGETGRFFIIWPTTSSSLSCRDSFSLGS